MAVTPDCFLTLNYQAPRAGDNLCWARAAYAIARYHYPKKWANWCTFVEHLCRCMGSVSCRDCTKFDIPSKVCVAIKCSLGVNCTNMGWPANWVLALESEIRGDMPVAISGRHHAWVVSGLSNLDKPTPCIEFHDPSETSKGGMKKYPAQSFYDNFKGAALMAIPRRAEALLPLSSSRTTRWSLEWFLTRGLDQSDKVSNELTRLARSEEWKPITLKTEERALIEFGMSNQVANSDPSQVCFQRMLPRRRSEIDLDASGDWQESKSSLRSILGIEQHFVGLLDESHEGEAPVWLGLHDSTLLPDLAAALSDLAMRTPTGDWQWHLEWLTVRGLECEGLRAREAGSEQWSVYYALGFWTYGLEPGVAYGETTFKTAMVDAWKRLSIQAG